MMKKISALLGAVAMVSASGSAYAQHIQSPNGNIVTLNGDARLNDLRCYLTLTVELYDDHGRAPADDRYNKGRIISGTNAPNPNVECPFISIAGGHITTTSTGINVDSLLIATPYSATPCQAAPSGFAAAAWNNTASAVGVYLLETTPCGNIEADLYTTNPSPVQLVP